MKEELTQWTWKDNGERLTWKEVGELKEKKFVYLHSEEKPIDLALDFVSVNYSVEKTGPPYQLQHHSKRGYGHGPQVARATIGLGRLEAYTTEGREATCPPELCLFFYFRKVTAQTDFALRPELKDQFKADNCPLVWKDGEFRIEVDIPYSKDLANKLAEATRLSWEALRELEPGRAEDLEDEVRYEEVSEHESETGARR